MVSIFATKTPRHRVSPSKNNYRKFLGEPWRLGALVAILKNTGNILF
jgi:hypothetical protein